MNIGIYKVMLATNIIICTTCWSFGERLLTPDVKRLEHIARSAISGQFDELDPGDIELHTVRFEGRYSVDSAPFELFIVVFRVISSIEKLPSINARTRIQDKRVIVHIEADGRVSRPISIIPALSEIRNGSEVVTAAGDLDRIELERQDSRRKYEAQGEVGAP